MIRRLLTLAALVAALAGGAIALGAAPAQADTPSVSRADAIKKVQEVHASIDRTLALIKAGKSEQAFQEAKDGYLNHFELVEIPLRVADNSLTIHAESLFAEIRTMIRNGDSEGAIRDKIVELRGVMDDVERKLTSTGLTAPALVLGQSFLIIFREGFEVILLLSVLLGYLEAAKSRQYMRPILAGVGIAAVATVLTVMLFRTIFAALPVGQEMLEAITALVAVAMLFYVSFWLIARLEHKRWLEFVKARMWSAVSVGSAASLMIVGFTAVYREGFETALFYQALISFGTGLGIYILAGLFLGLAALAVVAWLMFRLGRRLPDQDVHERRSRARHGHERRVPRQRRARAAGRRPRAVHSPRRVAAAADLPLRSDRLLADRADRHGTARAHRRLRDGRHLRVPREAPARSSGRGTSTDRADRRACLITAMGVRVGVDVGGTFTKAVAVDLEAGIVAESVLPTTHGASEGVAAGVVQCVAEVARKVGADQVEMVTHSTTQAVNALLEGDVGTVGIVGMGRRPELAKARKRTELAKVELSAGKQLATVPVFLDVTDGLDEGAAAAALQLLRDRGVSAIATAEAFAPDDASNEQRVAQMAASLGLPSCASTDLSGLYGLELRAVTAAVNASIMPIALRTASYVEEGVNAAGIDAPIMVMRGDGGATDLAGFKAAPARTLYSGPAASVAGALRYTGVRDGIVVEVGGTSTNVAGVKLGRPSLSYVTVASHATALRAGRRPRHRRRGRIGAPRSTREGLGRRAPLRAHRRASVCLLHRRGPPRRRATGDDRPARGRSRRLRRPRAGRRHEVRDHAHLRRERAVDPRARRLLLGRPSRCTPRARSRRAARRPRR